MSSELFTLTVNKTQMQSYLDNASEVLEKLDGEIIEADAIHKDLQSRIRFTRKQLRQAERDAEFQVAVVTDLKNDVIAMQEQYQALEASRIFSVQEEERLSKLAKNKQALLDTVSNEITAKNRILSEVESELDKATKNLNKIGDSDKVIRESLANKELKIQASRERLKSDKAELKKELILQQQIQPKLRPPKKDTSKGYYKI